MKSKYILQLKRYKLWEDLATYRDKGSAFSSFTKMRIEGFNVRIVEVFYI